MVEQIDEVLSFWFGEIEQGFPITDRQQLWWGGESSNDKLITSLFGHRVQQALRGELDAWQNDPLGRLALILLLDQFTRTIYRGSADAFSGDAKALQLCLDGLERGVDQGLEFCQRTFFYMPLEHAEDLTMQLRSISCFSQMVALVPASHKLQAETWLDFATEHHDQIDKFGRFPHRNELLGRSSTPEELAFLLQGHPRWGQ